MPRTRRHSLGGLVVASALALTAVACGGDDGGGGAERADGGLAAGEDAPLADRPRVTFSAADNVLDLPATVPAGLVDVRLESEPGELGHNIAVARLNDGVSYDDITGLDPASLSRLTVVGGNATVAPGATAEMTLDLAPGDYLVVDIGESGTPTAGGRFSVDAPETGPTGEPVAVAEPEAEGTVTIGPGMVISAPESFDGTGTWRFANEDPSLVHEAAFVRLAPGATVDDLVAWSHDPAAGPPPIAGQLGGMGGLGPGQSAWITLEPEGPGDYALVCWVPGEDGLPHMSAGMATAVTVS